MLTADVGKCPFQAGCVANNADIRKGAVVGQPTEGALVALAMKVCSFPELVRQEDRLRPGWEEAQDSAGRGEWAGQGCCGSGKFSMSLARA